MLDGFIIEELKRRERERARDERRRPVLEQPVPVSQQHPEIDGHDDWRRDERPDDGEAERPGRERKAPPSTVIQIDL